MMTMTLTNSFHGSTARVRGEATTDEMGNPAVRISDASKRRAERKLCGIKGCLCGNHGPVFVPLSNPSAPTDWVVAG